MVNFDAWSVAAAFLLRDGGPMDYKDLVDRVLNSKLSGLGVKGGATPYASLRGIRHEKRHHGLPVFRIVRRGVYGLWDPESAKTIPEVKAALAAIEGFGYWGDPPVSDIDVDEMQIELSGLRERNARLEERLRELSS